MINYAEKYSDQVDERFTAASFTDFAVNDDYDFDGVSKVTLYSVDVAPLNDYDKDASDNRYGLPVELGNETQVFELTQDKSFTFTIDRGNYDDTMLANSSARSLDRQIREVVRPAVDKYRLLKMASGAGKTVEEAVTNENAYSLFLDATGYLTEKLVPISECYVYITPAFRKLIKLDKSFTGTGDKLNQDAKNGEAFKIDRIPAIVIPTSYLPANSNFLITHPSATTAPKKLTSYVEHENPKGINGYLVEGRVRFDAFVRAQKKDAIYLSKAPA